MAAAGKEILAALEASDSRLPVIAEAFVNGLWQAIEYLPASWCGNSYHMVYLKPQQLWQCAVPKYSGKQKTKIRYRLELAPGHYLYSNEVAAGINRKQLTEKQGHKGNGLMDPYEE